METKQEELKEVIKELNERNEELRVPYAERLMEEISKKL